MSITSRHYQEIVPETLHRFHFPIITSQKANLLNICRSILQDNAINNKYKKDAVSSIITLNTIYYLKAGI